MGQPVQVLSYTTSTYELPELGNETKLEIVDLNQDGLLDLVAYSYSPENNQKLHTLLRTDKNEFAPVQTWEVGQPIREIQFGDLNGDGFPDILLKSGRSILTILNEGTEEQPEGVTWRGIASPVASAVHDTDFNWFRSADLNDDGMDDLVIWSSSTPTLTLRSTGDGQFATPISYSNASLLELTDANNDGHIDIVTAGTSDLLRVLVNDGSGVFEATTQPFPTTLSYNMLVSDLDLDGNADLVLSGEEPLSFGIGNGAGAFEHFNHQRLAASGGSLPFVGTVRVGDINHDGIPDIISRRSHDSLHPWIGPGGVFIWIGIGEHRFRPFGGTFQSTYYGDVDVLDFDQSGRNQIVLHDGSQIRTLELRDQLATANQYKIAGKQIQRTSSVTGDFDGNGVVDVVSFSYGIETLVHRNAGQPNQPFQIDSDPVAIPRIDFFDQFSFFRPFTADFNHDGVVDVGSHAKKGSRAGFITFFPSSEVVPSVIPEGAAALYDDMWVVADFDGDGWNDLVPNGKHYQFNSSKEAGRSYADAPFFHIDPNVAPPSPTPDVTGDGLPDAVTGGLTPNGVSLKVEQSSGPTIEYLFPVRAGLYTDDTTRFADVDGDGVDEVIVDFESGFAVVSLKDGDNRITDSKEGDFNEDLELGIGDIESLWTEVNEAVPHPSFDLTGDEAVDELDVDYWLTELAQTRRGDANLDGKVDFQDFLSLALSFGREQGWISWQNGDFTATAASISLTS